MTNKRHCSKRNTAESDKDALAVLDAWLADMVRCSPSDEIVTMLKDFVRQGWVRTHDGPYGPAFIIDIDAEHASQLYQLAGRFTDEIDRALLELSIEGKICFCMSNNRGHKDLAYSIVRK